MLGVIQALKDGNVKTPGTITFVADTGEEGLGDLRGTKNLFNDSLKKADRQIHFGGWHRLEHHDDRRRQLSLPHRI